VLRRLLIATLTTLALAGCGATVATKAKLWRASTKDDPGPPLTEERVQPTCSPDAEGAPSGPLGPQLISIDGEPAFAGVGICRNGAPNVARATAESRAYQTFSQGLSNYIVPLWQGLSDSKDPCPRDEGHCGAHSFFSDIGKSDKLITEYWENDKAHTRAVRKALKVSDLKAIIAASKRIKEDRRKWLLQRIDEVAPSEDNVNKPPKKASAKED
jgi:hypothetical protein